MAIYLQVDQNRKLRHVGDEEKRTLLTASHRRPIMVDPAAVERQKLKAQWETAQADRDMEATRLQIDQLKAETEALKRERALLPRQEAFKAAQAQALAGQLLRDATLLQRLEYRCEKCGVRFNVLKPDGTVDMRVGEHRNVCGTRINGTQIVVIGDEVCVNKREAERKASRKGQRPSEHAHEPEEL